MVVFKLILDILELMIKNKKKKTSSVFNGSFFEKSCLGGHSFFKIFKRGPFEKKNREIMK